MRVIDSLESEGLLDTGWSSLGAHTALLSRETTQHLVETVQIRGTRFIPQTIPGWVWSLWLQLCLSHNVPPGDRTALWLDAVEATLEIKK